VNPLPVLTPLIFPFFFIFAKSERNSAKAPFSFFMLPVAGSGSKCNRAVGHHCPPRWGGAGNVTEITSFPFLDAMIISTNSSTSGAKTPDASTTIMFIRIGDVDPSWRIGAERETRWSVFCELQITGRHPG
jgi:hypothetical protein